MATAISANTSAPMPMRALRLRRTVTIRTLSLRHPSLPIGGSPYFWQCSQVQAHGLWWCDAGIIQASLGSRSARNTPKVHSLGQGPQGTHRRLPTPPHQRLIRPSHLGHRCQTSAHEGSRQVQTRWLIPLGRDRARRCRSAWLRCAGVLAPMIGAAGSAALTSGATHTLSPLSRRVQATGPSAPTVCEFEFDSRQWPIATLARLGVKPAQGPVLRPHL